LGEVNQPLKEFRLNMETADAVTGELTAPRDTAVMPGFNSQSSWELANRIGKAFAASSLVPAQYQGNVANCIVALEMANRMGASPLMVMQNLYIVHGNPGWSSKFLIACFNQCGRFSSLRYEWTSDRTGCRAWATEKATGERIDGPTVTVEMAKLEGWSTKSGSKWKTMPELMLMYRAAAFLIRTYAPEISMGLRTDDVIIDMGPADVVGEPRSARADEVRALLAKKGSAQHVLPPAPPAATAQKAELSNFVERIDNAIDKSEAFGVVEEAREHLTESEHAELQQAFTAAWEA
jgi:hypothetical protein